MKTKKAFTLIELLVVIAIIGLLATISVVALNNARAKARDVKRTADIKQVQTALELFFNSVGRYPTTAEWNTGQLFSTTSGATSTYMQAIPVAPTPVDGNCTTIQNTINYAPTLNGASYSVSFCLGNRVGALTSGPKCLVSGAGIINQDCSCGESLIDTRDNQSYPTVRIGGQCFMAKNLAYLPSVVSDATPSYPVADYSIPYYYVYGYQGTDVTTAKAAANYSTHGVSYNYAAAMINCPTGWHLPTNDELNTLIDYLGGTTVAGGKLKAVVANGTDDFNFSALMSGGRGAYDQLFGNIDILGAFWSSNIVSSSSAMFMLLMADDNIAYREFMGSVDMDRAFAFSVRCLKD